MFIKQKRGRKLVSLLFTGLFFFGVIVNTISLLVAHAGAATPATSATWVDQATLNYQGRIFKENNASDSDWNFYEQNPANGCTGNVRAVINHFKNPGYNSAQGPYKSQTVQLHEVNLVPGGECTPGSTTDISLPATPDGYNISFVWQDNSNITSADGNKTFSKQSDGTFVSTTDNGNCKDYITAGTDPANLTLIVRSQTGSLDVNNLDKTNNLRDKYAGSGGHGDSGYAFEQAIQFASQQNLNGDQCYISNQVPVRADTKNASKAGTPQTGGGGSASATPSDNCNAVGSIFSDTISWIECAVIQRLDSATDWLDKHINAELEAPDYTNNANLKTAWGRIRNIALVILVPIMLVMVIGTAIGFSGLDAYTVRRAMPRLLIAVLFISISWYLTIFFVNLTNIVGKGILGLITQPFGVAGLSLSDFVSKGGGASVNGFAILGVLFSIGRVDLAIIGSFILVAAVALFVAFLVLIIRQILILALIILAPLAILSWIFPNNNDLWKLWWGTFSKLLIMYPLIVILIGAGRIGASIIPAQQGSESAFTNLLVIATYVLPYFLIPATFKFAGGALGSLAGMINDRSRGLFDRQRKFREEHRGELKKRSGAGFRYDTRW